MMTVKKQLQITKHDRLKELVEDKLMGTFFEEVLTPYFVDIEVKKKIKKNPLREISEIFLIIELIHTKTTDLVLYKHFPVKVSVPYEDFITDEITSKEFERIIKKEIERRNKKSKLMKSYKQKV